MSNLGFNHCAVVLKRILEAIEDARELSFNDKAISLLLPRFTVKDMWASDSVCRLLHQWYDKDAVAFSPGDLLVHGATGEKERLRQVEAELLAIRIRYGLDVTQGEWKDLLDDYAPTGDLKADLERILITSWYKNWFTWYFERFGRFYMPPNHGPH